jgi:hypothetical protein
VWSDAPFAKLIARGLTARGFRVFLDALCLEAGKDWEDGFCTALVQSRMLIPVISSRGLYSGSSRGDVSKLKSDSNCDNVVLEVSVHTATHSDTHSDTRMQTH